MADLTPYILHLLVSSTWTVGDCTYCPGAAAGAPRRECRNGEKVLHGCFENYTIAAIVLAWIQLQLGPWKERWSPGIGTTHVETIDASHTVISTCLYLIRVLPVAPGEKTIG